MTFEIVGKRSEPVVKLNLVHGDDGSIDLKGDEFFLGAFCTNGTFMLYKSGFEALGIKLV